MEPERLHILSAATRRRLGSALAECPDLSVEALGRLEIDHVAHARDEHELRPAGAPNAAPPTRAVALTSSSPQSSRVETAMRGSTSRRSAPANARIATVVASGWRPETTDKASRTTSGGESFEKRSRRASEPIDSASTPNFAASVRVAARRPRRGASPPSPRTRTQDQRVDDLGMATVELQMGVSESNDHATVVVLRPEWRRGSGPAVLHRTAVTASPPTHHRDGSK